MNELHLLQNYLIVGAILFGLGMVGFLARRNMIVMFLSSEMMLQGVALSLVGWGRFHGNLEGQMFVIFIITIAACEAAIALAMVLMLFRRANTLDMAAWTEIREANQPAYVDHEIPEEADEEREWPRLTPAGIEPEHDPEEELYRSRV